jgi:hypothetical protein
MLNILGKLRENHFLTKLLGLVDAHQINQIFRIFRDKILSVRALSKFISNLFCKGN